jgi:phosphatidylglycerol---prolipoprotein diacylglyceryl transferase
VSDAPIFNLDPVLLHMGPLQLRYYGIIFASMLYIGFLLWRWQMLRGGKDSDVADKYLIWGVVAVLLGSRLGHCLFYEPDKYLADPITILYFWEGGLSSHGCTVGLVVAMLLFSLKYKLRFLEVLDRFSMSAAVGAAAVRLGNFLNSEIVGRVTTVPWGVKFPRYDAHELGLFAKVYGDPSVRPEDSHYWAKLVAETPVRHPSQLYEFAIGLFVLFSLYMADRWAGREKRPLGLLAALFLVLYFAGRFCVEFVKEFQDGALEKSGVGLTEGQKLSIVPFAVGLVLLAWVIAKRRPTHDGPIPEPTIVAPARKPAQRPKKRSKR